MGFSLIFSPTRQSQPTTSATVSASQPASQSVSAPLATGVPSGFPSSLHFAIYLLSYDVLWRALRRLRVWLTPTTGDVLLDVPPQFPFYLSIFSLDLLGAYMAHCLSPLTVDEGAGKEWGEGGIKKSSEGHHQSGLPLDPPRV